MTIRIAMWSGPRNISTAMMRSWENRSDCSVVDEPFYAFYLAQTQSPHPMFEQVLASQSTQYEEVATQLSSGNVTTPVQYQKHMTHHMLNNCFDWAIELKHCFLIRNPKEVVASYTNSRGVCTAEEIGIIRQAEIYTLLTQQTGQEIPIIDSNDVLKSPEGMLRKLCDRLSVPFEQNMLHWPAGKRDSDGVWASHWYHSVERSKGFAPYQEKTILLSDWQQEVVEQVMPAYMALYEKRLR
ncbi:HAD family hydrolase [Planctobacterium marinum]|uniref:Branched chain amino acid aminotransferase n=1 Tax=Planctobacterium marinum TaxID=1631968 RepID=A0AA48HKT5_9ALTE|nr:branched chain amino acid aminotransferase [Planctobacterium marinum]